MIFLKLFQKLYLYWFLMLVIVVFLLLYPFTFLFLLHPKTYFLAHYTNKVWGFLSYSLSLIPWWTTKEVRLPTTAVYCANHFSYLDIPTSFLSVPGYFSIIGKASITKMPLFGYMFKKLYISVDRGHSRNRYQAYTDGVKMVESGRSIVVYPEGGIHSVVPEMARFKDGAFKIAIETNAPVVPMTIYNTWIMLRDEKKKFLKWRPSKVKFHTPIETKSLSLDDLDTLKQQVFDVIQNELNRTFGSC